MTVVLNRKLVIRLSVTQQEIGKVNPGIVIVEGEEALGLTEQILDLLIKGPAGAHLELMRSLGPGNVVANLVIVRLVVPGPTGRGVFGAGTAIQFDFRDAVEVVRARKQPGRSEAGGTCDYALGNDGDPVSVVVEGHLVEQRRTDGIGRVDHAAVRGVAEGVAGGRHVVVAPHGCPEILRDLL